MTDIEMTMLCAEAMNSEFVVDEHRAEPRVYLKCRGPEDQLYDPRHNDAQCFQLVKTFSLAIDWTQYGCRVSTIPPRTPITCTHHVANTAIVECVARMQAAKGEKA